MLLLYLHCRVHWLMQTDNSELCRSAAWQCWDI